MIAAVVRRFLWRGALGATGGLRVTGSLPAQPSVLVANHASHADTAALLAALPARRRPVVAAAADYWFDPPARRLVCRALVGAFPVRRTGGGSADLDRAAAALAAGHDVIVFPEGSRSRDGSVGAFRSGAARLAEAAGAPLVPVGIGGTRDLLPVHGRLRRAPVTVRIGSPVRDAEAARAAVLDLVATPPSPPDSRLRRRVAAIAGSAVGLLLMAAWAFGEAVVLPVLPEFALVILGLAVPRRAMLLATVGAAASLVGGATLYTLASHGVCVPAPFTTDRMHVAAASDVAAHGAGALVNQPMSGIPYKVYGAASGRAQVGLGPFLLHSAPARGLRILIVGAVVGLIGALLRRWRHGYPAAIALFVPTFAVGLAAVVQSWQ